MTNIKSHEHIVVMGVSGCGKSSFAKMIGHTTGRHYLEADTYHSDENVAKMSASTPLTDEDRMPWLEALTCLLKDNEGPAVLACSALKRRYREQLKQAGNIKFMHLTGSKELIANRMAQRADHYMPQGLLDNQFDTLEPPTTDENILIINIDQSLEEMLTDALKSIESTIEHIV